MQKAITRTKEMMQLSKKVTMHSGRAHANGKVFDPKHNDRNFDVTFAKNIKKDKLNLERYWNFADKKEYGYFDKGQTSFSDAELQYYNDTFGHQLDKTNANYIKNRHPERVTTMSEWMYKKQNAPEECYVQIGDSFGHPDMEAFHECFQEWLAWQNDWNDSHGNPFTILDYAEHFAEEVPQAHIRRVWSYVDENGNRRIGQEKALAMADVKLPNEYLQDDNGNILLDENNQPMTAIANRDNNRKKTFDSMARQKWIEIVRSHGIEVDDIPRNDVKHNLEKKEAIIQQLTIAQNDADKQSQRTKQLMIQNNSLDLENRNLSLENKITKSETDRLNKNNQELVSKNSILKQTNENLNHQINNIQNELSKKKNDYEQLNMKYHQLQQTLFNKIDLDNKLKQLDNQINRLSKTPSYFINFLKKIGRRKYRTKDGTIKEISYYDMYQESYKRYQERMDEMKNQFHQEFDDYSKSKQDEDTYSL